MQPRLAAVLAVLLLLGCKRAKDDDKAKSIVVTPEMAASAAGYDAPLVTLKVSSAGTAVSLRGENVAPGCTSKGGGVTVPAKNGEQDFAALTRCLTTLKATTPELAAHRSIVITASSEVVFATVIATMDAVRELFPDVVFGPPPGAKH